MIILPNIFILPNHSHAWELTVQVETLDPDKELNLREVFNFYWQYLDGIVPQSYQYITLNFKWVEKNSELYKSLQKLVYLDRIENKNIFINQNRKLSQYAFFKLSEKIFELNINYLDEDVLKQQTTTYNEVEQIKQVIDYKSIKVIWSTKKEVEEKKRLFSDVYSTLLNEHYDKANLDEIKVIESAIDWLTRWTNDRHTVYFPPTESESFHDSLSGEYEWIGSYVDMEQPGLVRIITPISWSPSEEAWLKWWDIISAVDDREVTKENSLPEVISWIKGPAGTKVKLTIKRWEEILEIMVTRQKIIINDIEHRILDRNTFYIEIKSFWENVSSEFKTALEALNQRPHVNRVVIDLRNNGWGYLSEVAKMLWYFTKEWETTAVVKYSNNTRIFTSPWYDLIDFSKYKIVLLQNSGTASASEIMIGTIKDYYPDVEIIGEKSYWKWSVQTLKTYSDGSTIKYTIAKWFTGLTQTGIDWVWIEPTIELEFDRETYLKNQIDNQLEKARTVQ